VLVSWEVEYTDEFEVWWRTLSESDQELITIAVAVLEEKGPGLGRPWADTIEGSRHANMKELRPRGGHIRVLFAFDPVRVAILLLGGDKRDQWSAWYEQAIPEADRLYDEHLDELRDERDLQ
jgi:hypothetical protein